MVSTKRTWSTQDVRDLVQKRFNKRPCYFQIKVAQALYAGKDVVACAPTGAGKTLTVTFWIPILMALEEGEDKMSIFVTPLNLIIQLPNQGGTGIGIPDRRGGCYNFLILFPFPFSILISTGGTPILYLSFPSELSDTHISNLSI